MPLSSRCPCSLLSRTASLLRAPQPGCGQRGQLCQPAGVRPSSADGWRWVLAGQPPARDEQHAEEGHSMYKRLAEASIQAIQTHHAPGCPALLPLAAGFPVTIDIPSIPGYTSLPGQVASGGQQRAAPLWATRHEHLVYLLAHVCPCAPCPRPPPPPPPRLTHTHARDRRLSTQAGAIDAVPPSVPRQANFAQRLVPLAGHSAGASLQPCPGCFFLPQLAALALAC